MLQISNYIHQIKLIKTDNTFLAKLTPVRLSISAFLKPFLTISMTPTSNCLPYFCLLADSNCVKGIVNEGVVWGLAFTEVVLLLSTMGRCNIHKNLYCSDSKNCTMQIVVFNEDVCNLNSKLSVHPCLLLPAHY